MKQLIFVLSLAFFSLWLVFRHYDTYQENEIRLGMSAALSGDLGGLGQSFYQGADAYFKDLNTKGGVHGRTIKLIAKDDQYEPKITLENIQNLIEKERVFALFGLVGTPTTEAILPLMRSHNTPLIAPVSGASFLRDPLEPLILNVRKGYHLEIKALLSHLIDEKGYGRIAVFYQNDSFGHTGLHSVKELLKERGMRLVGEGSYKRNTLAVGHAIYELEATHPDAVIMIGTARPVVEFIRRSVTTSLSRATKAIISFASAQTIMIDLQCVASNLIFSQVVPLPWGEGEDLERYRGSMRRHYTEAAIGFASLEGYLAAQMVANLFESLGPRFDKKTFVDAMETMASQASKHELLTKEENHCGCLDEVYITQYRNEAFEVIGVVSDE
ncbi:MAG: ABC transporter substrate-binding protein [Campylobacterales bacterium]|nr:ABC transporter substrate-binding protein [Campylobacterales bacterium]